MNTKELVSLVTIIMKQLSELPAFLSVFCWSHRKRRPNRACPEKMHIYIMTPKWKGGLSLLRSHSFSQPAALFCVVRAKPEHLQRSMTTSELFSFRVKIWNHKTIMQDTSPKWFLLCGKHGTSLKRRPSFFPQYF